MLRLRAGASLCCIRPAVDPGSLEAPPGVPLGLLVDVQPSPFPRKKVYVLKIYFLTTEFSEKHIYFRCTIITFVPTGIDLTTS